MSDPSTASASGAGADTDLESASDRAGLAAAALRRCLVEAGRLAPTCAGRYGRSQGPVGLS